MVAHQLTRAVVCVAVAVLFPSMVHGYSGGARASTCATLTPGHGGTGQMGPLPYIVEAMFTAGRRSAYISVSTAPGDTQFKGIHLQVRNETGVRRGELIIRQENANDFQIRTCDIGGTFVTHSNGNPKEDVTFEWEAPTDMSADETFEVRITVVQSFPTYWINQQFDIAAPLITSTTTTTTTTTTIPSPTTTTTTTATTPTPTEPTGGPPRDTGIVVNPDIEYPPFADGEAPAYCMQNGNKYEPMERCSQFKQSSMISPAIMGILKCPSGTIFSTIACVCNFPYMVTCPV